MILTLFGPSVADWSGTEESNWLQTAWGSTLFSFFYFHFFFLPPLGDRPYVRLIHICKQLLSSSYFTITVLLPNCLFPPHMLFSPQSSAGFLQPPSLTLSLPSLPLSLSPFFSSYLWKRHFKSLPVWISLVSCVFLPVNNPESRLSLFPSLSICQSAPPLNWKPLRPTSTHSIRAARLLLRLPFSAKIPFFFSFVPTARALENANTDPKLKLGLF